MHRFLLFGAFSSGIFWTLNLLLGFNNPKIAEKKVSVSEIATPIVNSKLNYGSFLPYDNTFLNSVTIDIKNNLISNESLGNAGLLCDWTEKKIVWSKKMFEPRCIASVTKMMVALITLEDIRARKLNWDTQIEISQRAATLGGSSVYLRRGEVLSVKELLKAAMIASGNDACYQLAEYNGGTEKNFVDRMNERAQELGMRNTRFSNSTGLPHPKGLDNLSSPVDLLLLANELLKYPEILTITKIKNETIRHGQKLFNYHNHNKLVMEYDEVVDGFKTGYTRKAGFCIVATAEKNGHRVIGVVLGSTHSVLRNKMVAELFNNYYSQKGLGKMDY
jgi:serine-type D-Ala-D-Ala carboxypeptidase (penicillin-binding protein 5/6)